MEEYEGFEKRRVVWFSEVFTVRRNGVTREQYNQDPRGGCVELVRL